MTYAGHELVDQMKWILCTTTVELLVMFREIPYTGPRLSYIHTACFVNHQMHIGALLAGSLKTEKGYHLIYLKPYRMKFLPIAKCKIVTCAITSSHICKKLSRRHQT